jgi:hypothetical protein
VTGDDPLRGCSPYMFVMFFMAFTLLVLKLAGAIDWSWWVVLLPAAMFVAPLILVNVIGFLLKLILERRK